MLANIVCTKVACELFLLLWMNYWVHWNVCLHYIACSCRLRYCYTCLSTKILLFLIMHIFYLPSARFIFIVRQLSECIPTNHNIVAHLITTLHEYTHKYVVSVTRFRSSKKCNVECSIVIVIQSIYNIYTHYLNVCLI